ncbi:MAG TPA: MFS transporter [Coxiellaceae bacterium]|nr:MFS transporter [Coxiellaceae bacterium]
MLKKYLHHLAEKQFLVILLLGFSSGLPLLLVGSTLQAWYTTAGVDLVTIGALTLVGQPYVYKFIWAPLLDRFSFFNMDRRRSWILLMQVALVITLVVIAYSDPKLYPGWVAFLALLAATFSATQDIAIDAYRTDLLAKEDYGLGSSLNGIGYRAAMIFTGAIALILAQQIGWRNTYLIMAALLAVEIFVTYWAPRPQSTVLPKTLMEAVIDPFREFMQRPYAVAILIFIVIYKLTDSFGLSLTTPFLIRGLGFSLMEVGSIAKSVSIVASILGTLAGGLLFAPLGLYRSLWYFGILQALANLSFVVLALVGKSYVWMAIALFADNFFSALGSVAFVAFLMALCNKEFTATQFALFTALSAVGRVFIGPIAAVFVEHLGWPLFYITAISLGIPALLLLWYLRQRLNLFAS